MSRVALAVLFMLLPATLTAQKRCVKGIPCGGTCISATKTCHVGSGTASAPKTRRTPVLSTAATVPDTAGAWVASSRGSVYYKATCSAAKKLSPKNRVFFKTEQAAKDAGYSHSRSKGC